VFIQQVKIGNEAVSWWSISRARMPDTLTEQKGNGTPPYIMDELLTYNKKLTAGASNTLIEKYKDVSFDSISAFYAIPKNLELPFSKNSITFNFVGVETTRPTLVSYQYKLDGYENEWNPITKSSTATFGNIHEGSYTFLVKARSPDGVWSEPLHYDFKILPPWYRSWYAYLIYLLLFLAGLYLLAIIQRKRVLFNEHQRAMKLELEHAREIEEAFTNLKSTQARLIHSEKMASLGELSAGVAHEIQNPLNFVANFSEVSSEMLEELKEELANGNMEDVTTLLEDVQQNLGKIKHHGKRADAIVKGMLQHSRTQGGAMEMTDINALIEEFLQLAYHGMRAKDKSFDVGFETDYDPSIEKIKIIPQDIGRALLNLLTNAFYACGERSRKVRAKLAVLNGQDGEAVPGGEPDKDALETYSPKVWVRSKKHSNKVEISVKDNGNGIPKDELNKIFQPFFTTKPSGKGTGLGLGLSKDIVNAHGGELKVKTREGKGTEFCIELPL
jgi:signal transduction histidine kinase